MNIDKHDDVLPRFFTVQQKFARPIIGDIERATADAFASCKIQQRICAGDSVAITVGSRGIRDIVPITRRIVQCVRHVGGLPFIVPAMGSHGGATAKGQSDLLADIGITQNSMGCEIRSDMATVEVCQAPEGFPVHFDRIAFEADHVLVVNRVKPHTRFYGSNESGLMKMMLIGLGKHQGAIVYHRVIQNYNFEQIVNSVANEVIERCPIAGGIAILENGYEETAEIVGVPVEQIQTREAELLSRVKGWMPSLPFDRAELLIVDEIGKNISGTGMDTNIIGRKKNDRAASGDEKPVIHHIYVRSLTAATQGNASGIGIAEMCHRRVLEQLDNHKTRVNSITAGHISAAMMPVEFEDDRQAIQTAIELGGWGPPADYTAMRIKNTLALEFVQCSEAFWKLARENSSRLTIVSTLASLQFDTSYNLMPIESNETE